MIETIQLPAQTRGAELRAQSFDEGANTIDIVWTTGATVRRRSWCDGPYDEQLDVTAKTVRLERLNTGAPFLNNHSSYDLDQVIGSVVPGSAKIERGQGVATILLSRSDADASIVAKIRDGIIRNVSVGYLVHAIEKKERGEGLVPLWRVTDWEPLEISAVGIPADPGAQIRSGAPERGAEPLHHCLVTHERDGRVHAARMRMRAAAARLA